MEDISYITKKYRTHVTRMNLPIQNDGMYNEKKKNYIKLK